MKLTIHKGKVRKITFLAEGRNDQNFLNVVCATFFEGGQLRAFPNESPPDAIRLDECSPRPAALLIKRRKAKK